MTIGVPAPRAPHRRRPPQIYWQRHGRGLPLVLVNGYAASAAAWPRSWLRRLEARFSVITVDNRGGGWSRFADVPFTMRDLAADIVAVLDEAETDSAVVLGLSMGGMIAQEVALTAPERVTALVLVATRPPVPYFHPPAASASMQMLRPLRRGESLVEYYRRLWGLATAPGFADEHPDAIDEMARRSAERPTPRGLMLAQMRAMTAWTGARRLAQLTVPTAVVHGTDDPMSPIENGRELARLIAGATYRELPGVGHLVPTEAPEALDAVLDELVAKVT